MNDGSRGFRYQVSPRLLGMGGLGLFGLLVLLVVAVGPGGWGWWLAVGAVAGLLSLTAAVGWVVWRHGPLEVRLLEDGLELPGGWLGARRRLIAWSAIDGVRVVGRVSAVRRGGREALYVTWGGRYVALMSDLFDDEGCYGRCRAALIAEVQARCPQARIDIDGRPVEADHSTGGISNGSERSS